MKRKDIINLLKGELSEVEKEMVENEHEKSEDAILAGRWYELDRLIEILEGSN